MLKKLLPAFGAVFGPLGVGFSLWIGSQNFPNLLGRYVSAVHSAGVAFMLLSPLMLVVVLTAHIGRWIKGNKTELNRLTNENRALKEQMNWQDHKGAVSAVAQCRDVWQKKHGSSTKTDSYEDDPVYLQLYLDPGLSNIVAQPIMQRLGHIKQLSFAYLTFRSATHTRLAHSLGACRNAGLVMRKIFQEGRLYTRNGFQPLDLTEEDKNRYLRLAMVTALVHDVGHGPLSHALEIHLRLGDEGRSRVRPDKLLSIEYIDKYLRAPISEAGVNPDDVKALIGKDTDHFDTPWMHFIGDLIDSPLDVDRMDYLVRDSHMTGLSIGALNMQALIERVVAFKEVENDGTVKIELAFDKSAVPYVEQFLYARDVMYINCYEKAKKVVAERMLGRAFDDFRKTADDKMEFDPADLALLTDQQIIELMLAYSGPTTLTHRLIEQLMKGTTFEELCNDVIPIKIPAPDELDGGDMLQKLPTEVRCWAEAAMSDDYERAYLEIPTSWARALSRQIGCDESQIIVTVPSWSIVDHWQKEGEVRILLPNGSGGHIVDHVSNISRVLADFTRTLALARLMLRVFVDPQLTSQQKARLRIEAQNLLGIKTQVYS